MISGPALPCPSCRKGLEPISWHDANLGRCWHCRKDFSFREFPARTAARRPVVARAVLESEEAACFYHSSNQAETVCESCGRFVCAVCGVDFGGRRICPPCIATVKETDAQAVTQRTLYDGIALALALLPILIWPITLVTAPVALGFVITGWRKPRSLVNSGRIKFICAGVLAVIQIAAWSYLLVWRRFK